jgi:hypothetical protein
LWLRQSISRRRSAAQARQSCSRASQEGVPFEEAHEGAWTLFERGLFRLADDGVHLGIEPCTSRNERRVAAKQNGLLASFRRRVAEDTASGKVRSPWSGVFAGPYLTASVSK